MLVIILMKKLFMLPFLFIWLAANEAPLSHSYPVKKTKASFQVAYRLTESYEGGYANVANDLGGETYRGISRKFCKDWHGWTHIDKYKRKHGIPKQNFYFNDLTDWHVIEFYLDIWVKEGFFDLENQLIANYLFDFRIHSPIGMKMIQQQLNKYGYKFKLDNQMNAEMVAAINKINPKKFLSAIKKKRIEFYNHLANHNPSQKKFLSHWLKRANV
jgi:lysozyme family protein